MTPATLFLVPVPLGHSDDITFRAVEILQSVDYVLGEDRKPLLALLKRENLHKEWLLVNEHTEKTVVPEVIQLLQKGHSCALVSDGGTPLMEDPGAVLVRAAIAAGIHIVPLPGANSIVPALVMSGLPTASFFYAGLLPRDPVERQKALRGYRDEDRTLVFLDVPYRLGHLLADAVHVFGPDRPVAIVFSISLPNEAVWRGTLGTLQARFEATPQKELFVLVVGGKSAPQFPFLVS